MAIFSYLRDLKLIVYAILGVERIGLGWRLFKRVLEYKYLLVARQLGCENRYDTFVHHM